MVLLKNVIKKSPPTPLSNLDRRRYGALGTPTFLSVSRAAFPSCALRNPHSETPGQALLLQHGHRGQVGRSASRSVPPGAWQCICSPEGSGSLQGENPYKTNLVGVVQTITSQSSLATEPEFRGIPAFLWQAGRVFPGHFLGTGAISLGSSSPRGKPGPISLGVTEGVRVSGAPSGAWLPSAGAPGQPGSIPAPVPTAGAVQGQVASHGLQS